MSNSRIWIKNPLAILTPEGVDGRGGIVIEGEKIIEVLALDEQPSQPCEQQYNASQHVVLPGLINSHHHFYQTLTRAVPAALNQPLFPWLQSLYPIWANLDSEMVALSSELALSELLLSGCTTASDHHYLFPKGLEQAIDTQVAVANKLAMRVVLTRGSMSVGEEQGGLPPQQTVQDEQQILDDCQRLAEQYHQADESAMVQIALAPCSPFSVSREIMRACAELAEQKNLRLHTHLAETLDEENYCLEHFGMRTVDYLEDCGWLNNRTWLAHGIHFDDDEIQRLGAAQVGVCHCPTSNMMLASGIARTLELEQAGSPVGLGVDGSASNDGSNMIQELRQALYLQRLGYGATVSHLDAYRWGTEGSAKLLGRNTLGKITVGNEADLALFKLDELRFSGSHEPLAALLLCGAHRADRVMVAGRWRVVDGQIEGQDSQQLFAKHNHAAQQLLKRL